MQIAAGDLALKVMPNGVIWAGMSARWVQVIRLLQADRGLTLDSGDCLAYFIDGGALDLPIAKRPPRDLERGYATFLARPVGSCVPPPCG